MYPQLAISPQLEVWFGAAFACLALGGSLTLVAQIRIRRYLPPDAQPYATLRDVFAYYLFQPETPASIRKTYVAGLAFMALAPFIGFVGVLVEARLDLAGPFLVLCAIAAFATFVMLRGASAGREPLP